jgi:hypothetical protein
MEFSKKYSIRIEKQQEIKRKGPKKERVEHRHNLFNICEENYH